MAQRRTRRQERRKRPRAEARLSMRVEARLDSPDRHLVTESQNISASGVYCTSTHYLAPLSKVQLTIVLPRLPGGGKGNELLKCEGIVVRCEQISTRGEKRYELACMFSELSTAQRASIEEFVTWRNLQALRAAANRVNGTRRRTTSSAKAARKRTTKAGRSRASSSEPSAARTTSRRKSTSRARPRAAAAARRRSSS